MLTLPRKRIDHIATTVGSAHIQSRLQAFHHLVAKSPWPDRTLLIAVAQWALPQVLYDTPIYWIIDDKAIF